mmetsp:Transcript_11834/g.21662  ORF Transcript_11834/g.21662 Transcript_11834/m.21662 type:complete len:94 (-) Transcript_11834:1101-1382(-)
MRQIVEIVPELTEACGSSGGNENMNLGNSDRAGICSPMKMWKVRSEWNCRQKETLAQTSLLKGIQVGWLQREQLRALKVYRVGEPRKRLLGFL